MSNDDEARHSFDGELRDAVLRRLKALFGQHRWDAHARDGHVVICDHIDHPVDRHLAMTIAHAVEGVRSVDALLRECCPHHGTSRGFTWGPGL